MRPLLLACALSLALSRVAAGDEGRPAAAALRAADAALDRAAAAHDRAAFRALLAPDTYWTTGGVPQEGPEAVLRSWGDVLEPGGPSLRWSPDRADVAESGDLGFTMGAWRYEGRDPGGKPVQAAGRYVTIWTRGADGAWRVLADGALRPATGAPPPDLVRTADRRATARSGELRVEAGRYTRGEGEHGVYLLVVRRAGGRDDVLVETLVPARQPQ
jgi:ketosteroid isomerase-like protein